MSRVVVIGAGAMGLAAAYRAARNGHDVCVVEAATEPGGMAGQFDFDGLSIERFYHFVCKTDEATFKALEELGLQDALHWQPTTMGLYSGGALHTWGDPVSLLRSPLLNWVEKIRYGAFAFLCVRRDRWKAIEGETAQRWITRWCGEGVFQKLWKPLLDFKFYKFAGEISATWIWTRIRRIGRSRSSMMQEELGYLEGGSMTLIEALIDGIEAFGGSVELGTPVARVRTERGRVTGVVTARGFLAADSVISTVPTPLVAKMVPDLPEEWKARYDDIRNIGCICLVFKLARQVTPHFWVNISEPGVEIPGVIEFSNLRPCGEDHVVYVPYYMPVTEAKFGWSDDALLAEAFACLRRLNPELNCADVRATRVARLRHAQPVCEPDFAAKLPAVQTPILGLQIADTSFYFPEDRGIAESLRLGQQMAEHLGLEQDEAEEHHMTYQRSSIHGNGTELASEFCFNRTAAG